VFSFVGGQLDAGKEVVETQSEVTQLFSTSAHLERGIHPETRDFTCHAHEYCHARMDELSLSL